MLNASDKLVASIERARKSPNDLDAMIELGGLFHDHGAHDQAAIVRGVLVQNMLAIMQTDHPPEVVLKLELALYSAFVKKIETEAHARACFQSWVPQMAAYGRRFQDPQLPHPLHAPTPQRPWRVAFHLHTSSLLGHTDALFETLRHRPRGTIWHDEPLIFVLNEPPSPALDKECAAVGARAIYLETDGDTQRSSMEARFKYLRQRIAEEGVTHLVWVSAPVLSVFAFAMRIAPVQIFWTLKFHPYHIPEVDEYITLGSWGETERYVHGERWKSSFLSIANVLSPVPAEAVAGERQKFGKYKTLFGVLSREEKVNSEPYLRMVVAILKRNPDAGFIWAGRMMPHFVQTYLAEHGVADRCHFIGWVNTHVYARVIDIFLETFPFGCGITAMQAMAAGTPFVSLLGSDTQHGLQFGRLIAAGGEMAAKARAIIRPNDGRAPLGFVETEADYLAMVQRLVDDPAFRQAVGAAGQHYYENFMSNGAAMGERYFGILEHAKQPADAAAAKAG